MGAYDYSTAFLRFSKICFPLFFYTSSQGYAFPLIAPYTPAGNVRALAIANLRFDTASECSRTYGTNAPTNTIVLSLLCPARNFAVSIIVFVPCVITILFSGHVLQRSRINARSSSVIAKDSLANNCSTRTSGSPDSATIFEILPPKKRDHPVTGSASISSIVPPVDNSKTISFIELLLRLFNDVSRLSSCVPPLPHGRHLVCTSQACAYSRRASFLLPRPFSWCFQVRAAQFGNPARCGELVRRTIRPGVSAGQVPSRPWQQYTTFNGSPWRPLSARACRTYRGLPCSQSVSLRAPQ